MAGWLIIGFLISAVGFSALAVVLWRRRRQAAFRASNVFTSRMIFRNCFGFKPCFRRAHSILAWAPPAHWENVILFLASNLAQGPRRYAFWPGLYETRDLSKAPPLILSKIRLCGLPSPERRAAKCQEIR
jgi:hypothetical protein